MSGGSRTGMNPGSCADHLPPTGPVEFPVYVSRIRACEAMGVPTGSNRLTATNTTTLADQFEPRGFRHAVALGKPVRENTYPTDVRGMNAMCPDAGAFDDRPPLGLIVAI